MIMGCSTNSYKKTVEFVDRDRFMGTWYVQAGRFTPFEKGVHNGVENYSWNEKEERIDISFTYNLDSLTGELKSVPQKGCLATKAEYSLRRDGKVGVKNTCKTAKGENIANAIASVADKKTNSKLKVSFVPFFNRFGLFAGDYWILDLASDYSYVLVGAPNRKFLWILSRTPELDANIIESLKAVARREGFDVEKLTVTPTWKN